jgi:hypothetical protein
MDVVIEFADEARAIAFEKDLKSGSGVVFRGRGAVISRRPSRIARTR